jgi:predicted RNA methylase
MRTTKGIGAKKLTDRQRELLSVITVGGDNIARFPAEPRIPDWKALKDVMVALGGKWKKSDGFAFEEDVDATELVRCARETGEIVDPRAADLFETSEELAALLADRLELKSGMHVLEPSAGRGALIRAVRRAEPKAILTVVEALEQNSKALDTCIRWNTDDVVLFDDFLRVDFEKSGIGKFDRVAMNPPFSKRADIHHVIHAFDCLAPRDGVLVAIMSAGVKYRDDKLGRYFRSVLEGARGEIWDNPPGSFKAAGTMVNTVMVRMRT